MNKPNTIALLILLAFLTTSIDLELDLAETDNVCTILVKNFDNLNLELKFPVVPNSKETQQFKIIISQLADSKYQFLELLSPDNNTVRRNVQLKSDNLYQLCVSFVSDRSFKGEKPLYIGYKAVESFEDLVGNIEIPQQLANQANLIKIYEAAIRLNKTAMVVQEHQQKQRHIQDEIVNKDVHKQNRIMYLTVLECMIVVLTGLYQVFALRKFLIEQNLY